MLYTAACLDEEKGKWRKPIGTKPEIWKELICGIDKDTQENAFDAEIERLRLRYYEKILEPKRRRVITREFACNDPLEVNVYFLRKIFIYSWRY